MKISTDPTLTLLVDIRHQSECVTFEFSVPTIHEGTITLELTLDDLLDLIRRQQEACDDLVADLEARLALVASPEIEPVEG